MDITLNVENVLEFLSPSFISHSLHLLSFDIQAQLFTPVCVLDE